MKKGVLASTADGREWLSGAGISIDGASSSSNKKDGGGGGGGAASSGAGGAAGGDSATANGSSGGGGGGGGQEPNSIASQGGVGQQKPLAQVRAAADRAMISCVREDGGHHSYFSRPPLRSFSLRFDDPAVEAGERSTYFPNFENYF